MKLSLAALIAGLAERARSAPGLADPDRGRGAPIAFDLFQDDTLILPVQVNGRPTLAIVDSGAAVTVLDREFARIVGLGAKSGATIIGNRSNLAATYADSVTIAIGDAQLEAQRVFITDLSEIATSMGRDIPLILGLDILRQRYVDIDFQARRLRLFETPPGRSGGVMSPISAGAHGQLSVPIILEDGPAIPALLDLGSTNALMIDAQFAKGRALAHHKPVSTALVGGADGMTETQTTSLSAVTFGGRRFKDVPCELFPKWRFSDIPAVIGLPLLSRFHLGLDISHDRLTLQPTPGAEVARFRRDLSGLGLSIRQDRLKVVHVASGGPGQAAGLKVGDEIVQVFGRPVGADYTSSGLWRWRFQGPGRTVTLRLSDSSLRSLTLKRYY